jgi:hypothetical protein
MSHKLLRTYPILQNCNNWEREVAQYFLRAFPQWDGYLALETFQATRYLVIKIPAPVQPTEHDLGISTSQGRLTVYFDRYHAHFYRSERRADMQAYDQAKAFIHQILDEQVVVCIRMEKDQWRSSMYITPEGLPTAIPADWTGYIRSWRGTYNTTITLQSD